MVTLPGTWNQHGYVDGMARREDHELLIPTSGGSQELPASAVNQIRSIAFNPL